MSIEKLVLGAQRTADTADAISSSFAGLLKFVLRDVERNLVPIVYDAASGSRTAIIKAALANKTRTEIRQALVDAGFDVLAETAYGAALDRIVARILDNRRLAQQATKLSGAFDQRLAALQALHETDLLDEGDALARALWQATVRGIFGARPADRILADLADVIDATEPQIRTLYDTSVSIFGRQVEALQAGDDPDATFAFMGPADQKNRPFCRDHVGKVYTRADIAAMDNGQLDNVFLTGGGYNCRHIWMEVSKFSELQDYVGTDKRIPEVEQQLQHLKEAA